MRSRRMRYPLLTTLRHYVCVSIWRCLPCCSFRRVTGFAAGLCAFGVPSLAFADIFHLASGSTVEGEIVSKDDENYIIKTPAGTITLPVDSVIKVEPAPSPFQEYDVRLSMAKETAADQFALAEWCHERGLQAERKKHLQRTIELDPEFAPARAALGHVRVGEFWVDGRSAAKKERPAAKVGDADPNADTPDRNDEKVVSAIQSNWIRRIRSIRIQQLESNTEKVRAGGRQAILEIRDPLAILPMSRVLGAGGRASRELLVEALSLFNEDEATMNLAALSLVDMDRGVRDKATSELKKRDDPRIAPQMRKALRSDNDELIRRAAYVLGEIKDASAIPELIEALKVRRWKMVEVPVRRYFGDWYQVFNGQSVATISGQTRVTHNPQIGVFDVGGLITIQSELQAAEVTVYRTEVLEALKSLTGENFGFEIAAWRRWYEEKKP